MLLIIAAQCRNLGSGRSFKLVNVEPASIDLQTPVIGPFMSLCTESGKNERKWKNGGKFASDRCAADNHDSPVRVIVEAKIDRPGVADGVLVHPLAANVLVATLAGYCPTNYYVP